MFNRYANGIEEHQNDNEPVEPLCFHRVPDPETETFFRQPKTFTAALVAHFCIEETYNRSNISRLRQILKMQMKFK